MRNPWVGRSGRRLRSHGPGSFAGRLGAVAAVVGGLLAGPAAIPAAAQDGGPLDYVAFGDSYTAGIGAGVPGPSELLADCFQTSAGYVNMLDQRDDVDLAVNAACAGWTAAMVPLQVASASTAGYLNAGTDLVTITAGANDVNFITALVACLTRSEAECRTAVNDAKVLATTVVPTALAQAYGAIQAQAPGATIAALGYPHLFSTELGFNPYISIENAEIFNAGTDSLNRVIRNAAKASGAVYVDVTDDFAGHGIGSSEPWINFNPLDPWLGTNFHPTVTGYTEGYAAAVVEEVELAELVH